MVTINALNSPVYAQDKTLKLHLYLAWACPFCHRVLVLDGGRVVEQGTGADLLAHPQAAITRTLVEACPRLPALP